MNFSVSCAAAAAILSFLISTPRSANASQGAYIFWRYRAFHSKPSPGQLLWKGSRNMFKFGFMLIYADLDKLLTAHLNSYSKIYFHLIFNNFNYIDLTNK